MPELKCTVQNCVHNKQYLCDLDKIQVDGGQAKSATDTCCGSFQEKKEGYTNSYSNSSSTPSDKSCVDCKATGCMYNCDCNCQAGKISVEGGSATKAEGTECATFQCKG